MQTRAPPRGLRGGRFVGPRCWLIALGLLLLAAPRAEAAAVWPGGGWVGFTLGGGDYTDPVGDENPDSTDIVGGLDGGVSYTAGFYNIDVANDQISFRLRLDADGSSGNYVWQILLDTDGDASTVDWVLQVRQSGSPSDQQVLLTATTIGGPTFADIDITNPYSWTGTIPDWTRWIGVTDGSTFDNDPDFFLDIGMPLSTFQSITGLSAYQTLNVAIASSTSHTASNKDLPAGANPTDPVGVGWGDGITFIPEPGTHLLVALGLCVLAAVRRVR